jgi:hypothetical protein
MESVEIGSGEKKPHVVNIWLLTNFFTKTGSLLQNAALKTIM